MTRDAERTTRAEQPIVQYELQRAKDKALEMARAKHKSFGVDLLYLGVEAAFDYCDALVEATQDLARGEIKVRDDEIERLRKWAHLAKDFIWKVQPTSAKVADHQRGLIDTYPGWSEEVAP
jgi:hypothetical protein